MQTYSISQYIQNEYKQYARYILINRGIPNFYDSLTPIQRIILLNTPHKQFTKTLKVIGDCISNGYHHGDASLESAINRLARPFDCAFTILEGDGFFGNQVNPNPAAARYTSVKLNDKIWQILSKYSYLNEFEKNFYEYENTNLHLKVDFPIGLLTFILGIAVGYKVVILPRKFEEIQKYLSGQKADLKPYFRNYQGKINYNSDTNSWIFESVIDFNEIKKIIHIKQLAPLISYQSILDKINQLLLQYPIKILNHSKTNIDLILHCQNIQLDTDWNDLKSKIRKILSISIKENIIFIKDQQLKFYNDIKDYLDEFKNHIQQLEKEKNSYYLKIYNSEAEFLDSKIKLYEFLLKKNRNQEEIKLFLSQFKNNNIIERLSNLRLIDLSKEKLRETKKDLKQIQVKISEIKSKLSN